MILISHLTSISNLNLDTPILNCDLGMGDLGFGDLG